MDVKIDWAQLSEEVLEERRKGKRVKLRYELEVSGQDGAGKSYSLEARTRDVSEIGCCFEIDRPMVSGENVSLKVKRKNGRGTQEITSPIVFRIMWAKRENELCVVGAEMIAPQDPWRIAFPQKTKPSPRP